ncbi:type VI secretion system membrane subunit TssM [Candidatus Methylomicrobium oryzae]|uniref:type VI secretion system membrane subunit TssM n=1 Tax=Candidatus Methylomicrobium oryzae TaxID=2802053 RepID=UPI001924A257|nr:type VI secretion system membrane subunit TssM [Methylomicrobium sp. RS1]MBL1265363.1 type VI secretion system membrane subunit TssM [Methylomicrobium sp. RS1]
MKLFNFIKARWFISLLGLIGLALLIWFVGPLFAFAGHAPLEPEGRRWGLIMLVAAVWLAVRLWSYLSAKRMNSRMLGVMAAPAQAALNPDELASKDELQTLQERMQDALSILKKAKLGGRSGRQFLYQLPWYIIIGPPGSGKSTLLKTSDLKFPLSAQYGKDAIRGVGGTRNCDWWFADEAVLLDTAGRYTTQDSNQRVDQSAWLGFLDLLKKYRPRRPINGAIVAISIADLLTRSKAEQQAAAHEVRKRIQELHERFNMRFPVYMLFTKCDLLAGFMEYFDDLDRDRRAEVWGMTFELEENPAAVTVDRFAAEFDLLAQRLQNQLVDKLERERGAERRNYIYTFPQQFASLQDLIQPFLNEIFQPTRYEHTVMLRGVYFTSATQEGSPIDRIMGALAGNFGLDRQNLSAAAGQGKSFFINRLLSDVIFRESGLAGTNLKLENKRVWLQRGAFAAVGGAALLFSLLWLASFAGNKAYIRDVAAEAQALQANLNKLNPEDANPLALLPILDKARSLPGGYGDREKGTPLMLSFGLYQGDKLGEAAISLYRKLLKDLFLSRLMNRMEQQLQNNADNGEYLYEALKVYLMLNNEHYDPSAIRTWITLDWKHNLPPDVGNDQRESLNRHLDALLETRPVPLPRPLDGALIRQTRGILENTPIADRIYSRLKLELADAEIPDFQIAEKAGRDALLVLATKSGAPLTKGVPGFFTCAGYRNLFLKNSEQIIDRQAGDNWIVGAEKAAALTDAEVKDIKESVLKHYLEDYIRQWDGLLSDMQIKPFSSQTQMVEILNIVSGEHSPLRQLLQAVDKETSFACLAEKDKSLLDKASSTLSSARSTLDTIISKTPEALNPAPPTVTTNLVTEHFKELHEFVATLDGSPPPLDRSLSTLNELYVYLNSLLNATGDELALEQRKQVVQVINKVTLEGKRNPFPVSKMMANIAEGSNDLVSGGIHKHLNDSWKSQVLPFCQKAIQGLYPIARGSREITYEDFTFFFGPNGLVDTFFTKYLAPSVEKTGRDWVWNTRGESGSGLSAATLKQFQLADTIKNIFFRMGKQTPAVSFKLKPISMSPSITQFVLDVDGQVLTYAHGPVRPVSMKWPGPNDSGQVRVQLLPPLPGDSGLSKEGPWALFRVFDEAEITKTSNPTTFIVTFNIQGREAKFELTASSAINPFQLSELQTFRCLPNL